MNLKFIKRIALALPLGVVGTVSALSYYAISSKTIAEDQASLRWYLHGLIYQDVFDNFQKGLVPYKIKVISQGCIVDDDAYKKDIRHNQQVYEAASPELKQLLGEPRSRI